jgi:hypothetical protein
MPIPCSPIRIMRVSGPARTRGMKDHGSLKSFGSLVFHQSNRTRVRNALEPKALQDFNNKARGQRGMSATLGRTSVTSGARRMVTTIPQRG